MSPDAIKKFISASPFIPFTIFIGDGRSVHIPHPEFVSITRTGRNVIVTTTDEDFEFIDVFLITSAKTKRKAQRKAKP